MSHGRFCTKQFFSPVGKSKIWSVSFAICIFFRYASRVHSKTIEFIFIDCVHFFLFILQSRRHMFENDLNGKLVPVFSLLHRLIKIIRQNRHRRWNHLQILFLCSGPITVINNCSDNSIKPWTWNVNKNKITTAQIIISR